VVERCFHALDTQKVQFHDVEQRCTVASAGAAAVPALVGICLLSQPYIAVGAVVVLGAVVVAVAIHEELEAYELRRSDPEEETTREEEKPATREPLAEQKPKTEGSGQDWPPPVPPEPLERERRPECTPRRVPPKGGNALHNKCADNVPFNAFRGANALVNGKAFDALQVVAGVLWEVKTDNFDTYPLALQDIVVRKQARELRREQALAAACGFDFQVGVRSAAHKTALEFEARTLKVVVMDWC
jgi:hypothetical protein